MVIIFFFLLFFFLTNGYLMDYFKILEIIHKVHALLRKKKGLGQNFKVIPFTDVLILVTVESVNNT